MLNTYRFTIFLGALGALSGIVYAEFVGCDTGCVFKSSPFIMAGYGVLFGGIIGSWIDAYFSKKRNHPS